MGCLKSVDLPAFLCFCCSGAFGADRFCVQELLLRLAHLLLFPVRSLSITFIGRSLSYCVANPTKEFLQRGLHRCQFVLNSASGSTASAADYFGTAAEKSPICTAPAALLLLLNRPKPFRHMHEFELHAIWVGEENSIVPGFVVVLRWRIEHRCPTLYQQAIQFVDLISVVRVPG